MSGRKCFKPSCLNEPWEICDSCEAIPVPFCVNNAIDHKNLPSEKNHRCAELYFSPDADKRRLIINEATETKIKIRTCRNHLISESQKVIKILIEAQEKSLILLKDLEKHCNKAIKLCSEERVLNIISDENSTEMILKLPPEEALPKISQWKMPYSLINLEPVTTSIKNLYESWKNNLADPHQESSSNLKFFWNNKLIIVDLESMEITSTTLRDISEVIGNYTSICLLPDQSIFCYGNSTFKIDKNNKVEMLSRGKSNFNHTSAYKNGYVYSFGGQTASSVKFSLAESIWEDCAPLPQGDYRCTYSVVFFDEILITSFYIGHVISYNTNSNSFRMLSGLSCTPKKTKVLLNTKERVYIFESSSKVYESGANDISIWWNLDITSIPHANLLSCPVLYKNSIFFVTHDFKLHEFKLKSKELKTSKITFEK